MKNLETKHVQILHVEDNEGDVLLTQHAFKAAKTPHTISVAQDGELALDYLYKRNGFEDAVRPDLILLDWNMPKKDGCEVLKTIKEDEALCLIPVIVFTSSQTDLDVIEAYRLYANSYVLKPADLGQFAAIVNAIDSFWLSMAVPPPFQG